ncbi:MAG: tetratricopeptide repeat protein [Fimbriimonas sp.]|nr:tetratricopeptide repeat protein [Fimbriimonas sp.]
MPKALNNARDTGGDNSPPPLAMRLFGSVEIRVHGIPLPHLKSRKGLWLLALLTLRKGQPVERNWLAGALWPDSSQSQALAYLRHCLTELRHALGTEAARLQSPTRQMLALDLAGAEADVLTFDAAVLQGDSAGLRLAVEAYQGPLLDDCAEEWALLERGNREVSFLAALRRLADESLARGDAESAIADSRRIIGIDPSQEGAQRTLIEALASMGDHGAVAKVYRDLRLYLHCEFKTEPDAQTTALYNRLRAETRQRLQDSRDAAQSPSTPPPPRRLPRPLTDLLGRDAEVGEVAARLRQRRLVTLTGPGGLGKTRAAIAVAEAVVEELADGAWFVELAGITDAKLVVQSVATTLGVRDESGRTLHDSLLSFLRPKMLLLVMDNCEHLLQACATLAADLLDGCSGVRILATSRQALGITGEVNWPLPLLPVPDVAHLPTEERALLANLCDVASVQLFVERAEAMHKEFALTVRNALTVARICERLDGMPLAIELAAGNVKFLPIEQISLGLDDVFHLLTRGSRTALPRQQTLQATLDWSYDLLTEPERLLLQRLSVFADGWTLEASEQVCASTGDENLSSVPVIEIGEVLDLLTSLVDKSLVQVALREDNIRYRMLETVRQYARDRLAESGASDAVRTHHRDTYLALAEAAEPKLRGEQQGKWIQHLEDEHENLLVALDWSMLEASNGTGLRFCGALSRFWVTRGHLSEGRDWCTRVLGTVEGQGRATLLDGIGTLASHQGDYASARSCYEESLAIYRELGDRNGVAHSLNGLGNAACNQDDYSFSQAQFEECRAIYQEIGDRNGVARSLSGLGRVAEFQSDFACAQANYEQTLAIYREIGDRGGVAHSWNCLGNAAFYQGDYSSARAYYQGGVAIYREIGDRGGIAYSLNGQGIVALAQGDHSSAQIHFEESLDIYREIGDRRGIACLLHDLGAAALAQNELGLAQARCVQSQAIAQEIGDRRTIADSLRVLGKVATTQGDYTSALAHHRESLAILTAIGNRWAIAESLDSFATIAAHRGKSDQAATLWGGAEALRAEIGATMEPSKREEFDRAVAEVRQVLGEEAFSIAWAHGSEMMLEAVIAVALTTT